MTGRYEGDDAIIAHARRVLGGGFLVSIERSLHGQPLLCALHAQTGITHTFGGDDLADPIAREAELREIVRQAERDVLRKAREEAEKQAVAARHERFHLAKREGAAEMQRIIADLEARRRLGRRRK